MRRMEAGDRRASARRIPPLLPPAAPLGRHRLRLLCWQPLCFRLLPAISLLARCILLTVGHLRTQPCRGAPTAAALPLHTSSPGRRAHCIHCMHCMYYMRARSYISSRPERTHGFEQWFLIYACHVMECLPVAGASFWTVPLLCSPLCPPCCLLSFSCLLLLRACLCHLGAIRGPSTLLSTACVARHLMVRTAHAHRARQAGSPSCSSFCAPPPTMPACLPRVLLSAFCGASDCSSAPAADEGTRCGSDWLQQFEMRWVSRRLTGSASQCNHGTKTCVCVLCAVPTSCMGSFLVPPQPLTPLNKNETLRMRA